MSVNFNNTTPAAPTGNSNVTFQNDGSGNLSAYVPTSGTLIKASNVDLTAQAANIATTPLYVTTAAGQYRIEIYIIVTQAATTSSTLPSVVIAWTDQDNSAGQTFTLTPAAPTGNSLTTYAQGILVASVKNASTINYSTSSYASSGATPMQYAIHLRIEAL